MVDLRQENFAKAFGWTGRIRSRYLNALAVFRIFESFKKLTATNVIGKRKAEENVKALSQHLYFFSPLQEAARCYFIVELAKFFDEDPRKESLTIVHLLDFTLKNLSSFSRDEFLKYHSNRNFIPEIFVKYKSFNREDIFKVYRRLKRNKKTIDDLMRYRNKFLAHDDIKKQDVKITALQIKTLFKIVQDAIDLFYLKLDFSSNMYSNYNKEPVMAVNRVLQVLKEHEETRLRKIKAKYG